MHKDFLKIQQGFDGYYCKDDPGCKEGSTEFQTWVDDLGLDVEKSYGKSMEAFTWAKDMISILKEDEENVYYKILFAFPWESMNGNVYTEAEIEASIETILTNKKGSPSLNHWEDTRKAFQEGGVKYVGSGYEDGACEAILQVPKDFICPLCGEGAKKTLTSLIDEKKIVNVSLEASCGVIGPGGSCLELEFDPPTLLTANTLPGVPMARIFPLERIMSEALAPRTGGKRVSVKIRGLGEILPDGEGQCPDGYIMDGASGTCVENKDCPDGQHWNDIEGKCVADEEAPPQGTEVPLGTPAAPDNSKKPVEAMTEDEIKDKITALQKQIDDYYGGEPETDYATIEPVYAELTGYKDALAALIKQKALNPEDFKDYLAMPEPLVDLGSIDCPDGTIWDQALGRCINPNDPPEVVNQPINESDIDGTGLNLAVCPEGWVWDPDTGRCVMGPTPAPKTADAPLVTDPALAIDAGAPLKVNADLQLELSEAKLAVFKEKQKFNSAEEEILYLKKQNQELIKENLTVEATLNASKVESQRLQGLIDSRDKALIEKDKEVSRRDMTIERMTKDHEKALEDNTNRFEVTSNARNEYKTQLDELRTEWGELDETYRRQLEINLEQTKKLRLSTEKELELEGTISELRTTIKKAVRSAKIIVKMTPAE